MLSVVILARNEEINIARCVQSAGWSDDVLVVDDGSTDRTRQLAEECGARVVSHRFESFAQQRNWALDHGGLKHPWVLMLDADETVTDEFSATARRALAAPGEETAGYLICRRTQFLGRWLKRSDSFPVWIVRLVHRDRARFVDHGHGERAESTCEGSFARIEPPIEHCPVSHGISDWITRHNRYSTREADLELSDTKRLPLRGLFARDRFIRRRTLRSCSRRLPLRPLLRFLHQYCFRGGFMEGRAGLAWCGMMAIFEAMIVIKRWEHAAAEADSTPASQEDAASTSPREGLALTDVA